MAQAQVGQTVTATVGLESANAPNCGLRVRWGDGAVTERKINDPKEMPFVTTHTYAKAGTAIPDKKPVCPGELSYCENSKKGMFGCKP